LPVTAIDWPFRIGSTQDIAELLDTLFVYAYCIEQAKRHLREVTLLPELRL